MVEISFSSLDRRAGKFVTETVIINRKHGGGGCHRLTPVSEVVTTDPSTYHIWICMPIATRPSEFLFGPASLRSTRAVVYTSERNVCNILCPCLGCSKCSDLTLISLQDRYQDHNLYHHVPHNSCPFCSQLLTIFLAFSYNKVVAGPGGSFTRAAEDVVIKSYKFRHSYNKYGGNKPLECEECGKLFNPIRADV